MALIQEGLWNIVKETETSPCESTDNGAAVVKYELQEDRALATIVLSMEPTLLYLLGLDPDDPVQVRKKLPNSIPNEDLGQ